MEYKNTKEYLSAREQALKITDGLGRPIDKGILELVILFNLYGISTIQSCEGHKDGKHGEYFFIDFPLRFFRKVNHLLTGCFGRCRPLEYTFYGTGEGNKLAIRLQPIIKNDLQQSYKDLNTLEQYLAKNYGKEKKKEKGC